MRPDRFFSLRVFLPFCKNGADSRDAGIPILMYHSVSQESETGVSPYYRTVTSPEIFRQHMRLLKASGYLGANLKTAIEAIQHEQTPKKKLAIITFDDGYRDFYTHAFPALKEHAFSATMFLPTAFIGDQHRVFNSRECMTWAEVMELKRAGIHFGSHTVTHPMLVDLGWPEIKTELCNSKAEIEQRLGAACDTFAFPFAFPETNRSFVRRFGETLSETGYRCCATTRIGRAKVGDDLMQLKRLPANSCDDPELFQAKLDGAYDWIAPLQSGFKRIKSALSPARPRCGCSCKSGAHNHCLHA